ncbi:hypothetical protein [Anaerosolibacter sp.]|uniref:hypothetical protein n=1 Tax=Anaerosolibacter sp. TaxID=1872527 RepID=UPI0039EED6BC
MWKHYYVNKNKQANGDYEVHTEDCSWIPGAINRQHLGYFNNCKDAVKKAKDLGYSQSNGCYYCSKECHTR